jgi:hypothetical protein
VSRVELLTTAMEASYARLHARLEGLTDEELFWQPLPDCWTIHQDASGRWTYDYAVPDPDPAPLTTLGWQLVHLATSKLMYHEWAFGAARLTWPELDVPHTAATATRLLEQAHEQLRQDLRALSEIELDEPRRTNWGELWPAWRIFSVMADHDALHGGVMGHLRDLHRWSQARSPQDRARG